MIRISKVSLFVKKHKLFFVFLLFLPIYHWLIVKQASAFSVNLVTYAYYTVDYSMGFCDKFLPGALYHLLVGKYNFSAVSAFVTVFYILFIAIISLLLEKFVLNFENDKKACLTFVCLFILGPLSIGIFVYQFGMLDFFWAFFFVLALACLKNKYLKLAVPIFAGLMVMVHYGAMISYVPALLLIVMVFAITSDSKKTRISYIIILILSLAISVGLTLYFIKNNSTNLVYTFEQFTHILRDERGADSTYYDGNLYNKLNPNAVNESYYNMIYSKGILGDNSKNGIIASVLSQIKATIQLTSPKKIMAIMLLEVVPYSVIGFILFGYVKAKKKAVNSLLAILTCLCPLIGFFGLFFSTDCVRWAAHSVMACFAITLVLISTDYKEWIVRVDRLFSKIGYHYIFVFMFFYCFTVLDPYII